MREKRLQVRTHYIHRLHYSTLEKLVGAFVLLAISMLIWLLFSSGKSLLNFEEHYTLYGQLDNIQSIDQNTEIMIGGLSAGKVQSVKITDENHIIVVMEILKQYNSLIRSDSTARLNAFNLGMINQSFIEISVGSAHQDILTEGSTIIITESINIKNLLVKFAPAMEALFEMINRTNALLSVVEHQQLKKTINHVDSLVSTIDPQQLKQALDNLYAISADASQISKRVNAGGGIPVTINSIDQLVSAMNLNQLEQISSQTNELLIAMDPALISAIIKDVHSSSGYLADIISQIKHGKGIVGSSIYDNETMKHFKAILNYLSKVAYQLDKLLIRLTKELENMPDLLKKIEPLLTEADKTIKATQKVWPISTAIEDIDNNEHRTMLISPEPVND